MKKSNYVRSGDRTGYSIVPPPIWKYSVEVLPDIDLVMGRCSIVPKPYHIPWDRGGIFGNFS